MTSMITIFHQEAKRPSMKWFYLLPIPCVILINLFGCIPTAMVVEWGHLRIKDHAQIKVDKAECEEKAKQIVTAVISDTTEKKREAIKISAVDRIFQTEYTACMQAKEYYKTFP